MSEIVYACGLMLSLGLTLWFGEKASRRARKEAEDAYFEGFRLGLLIGHAPTSEVREKAGVIHFDRMWLSFRCDEAALPVVERHTEAPKDFEDDQKSGRLLRMVKP